MVTTHKHHIIPKHMGGSDDPSNLVELTIEQHAEAHRILHEQYGKWQDKIAYDMLYECHICGKMCRGKGNLKQHLNKHIPKEV